MKRWIVVLMGWWAMAATGTENKPLIFGVLNQQSPQVTAERWNPILQYLSEVSGIPLQLRMGPTVTETDAMMARGEFDLVFSNHNFQTEYDGTYRVLARWGSKNIFGVIAVRADSPIKSLKDLQGRKVAYPSREAFVAYAVPKLALQDAKVNEVEVMANNQEGALAQLASGLVDAAAVNSRFLTSYAARKGLAYRELYTSPPYPDLAISVHPRVPAASVASLKAALLGMKADPKAARILERSDAPGFESATERDYDGVRRTYRRSGQ